MVTRMWRDGLTTISGEHLSRWCWCSKIGIEIAQSNVIVIVLLVNGILDAKNLFTALMPSQVKRFLPLENNIASAHFLWNQTMF